MIAIVYYTVDGIQDETEVVLPENFIGRHDLTCDYIDSIMGGNDKWDGYDIKDQYDED